MTATSTQSGTISLAFLGANFSSGGGVGDYTRRLSTSLVDAGHQCVVLDRNQETWPDFVQTARASIAAQNSTWVVLQFVCYSWGWQGVINQTVMAGLREICTGHQVAVYFHELWIGEEKGASIRHRLIGSLQRRSILKLLHQLAPRRVITSNAVYQTMLAREGYPTSILPLPGNLPFPTEIEKNEADSWLKTHASFRNDQDEHIIGVIFGTIHRKWDARPAMAEWVSHVESQGKKAILFTLGAHGPEGEHLLDSLGSRLPSLKIITTGRLSSGLIAAFLLKSDIAFATTPWALIGKSGTVAAFRDFGIPVVVPRDNWQWRRGPPPRPSATPDLQPWSPRFDWASALASKKNVALSINRIGEELVAVLNDNEGNR